MDVRFPLFAFEKDDDSMFLIEKPDRLLYHFEWIDIENEEFIFWDSTGAGVCVTVKDGAIDQIYPCEQSKSLSDALKRMRILGGLRSLFRVLPSKFGRTSNRNFQEKRACGLGYSPHETSAPE
jgi:hypothetical protein